MVPSDFGSLISASEAHTYVEDYKSLRDLLVAEVLPLLPDDAPQNVKDSVTFHKSNANAFIFDAAIIRSLLAEPDAPTYFAVFLGAIGVNPTVVVTGLKEGPQTNTLITIRLGDAGEHPRLIPDAKYPSGYNGPITVE